MERCNCSTSGCGSAAHPLGSIFPHKVIRPSLLEWIEKPNEAAGHRIDSFNALSLMAVAKCACRHEVGFFVGTPSRLWYNVIDFQDRTDKAFAGLAVGTTVGKRGENTPAHGLGQRLAHAEAG